MSDMLHEMLMFALNDVDPRLTPVCIRRVVKDFINMYGDDQKGISNHMDAIF